MRPRKHNLEGEERIQVKDSSMERGSPVQGGKKTIPWMVE